MRKIIDGKMYNTETAAKVGEWNNGRYGDFEFVSETLYRKRTGEYFLHGEGGAMSKYAESCGQNQWQGGASIIPIGKGYAREWAERHLSVDEYIAEFGEPDE